MSQGETSDTRRLHFDASGTRTMHRVEEHTQLRYFATAMTPADCQRH